MWEDEWVLLPSTLLSHHIYGKVLAVSFLLSSSSLWCLYNPQPSCKQSCSSEAPHFIHTEVFLLLWGASMLNSSVKLSKSFTATLKSSLIHKILSEYFWVYLNSGCYRAVSLHFKMLYSTHWEVLHNHITAQSKTKSWENSKCQGIVMQKLVWLLSFQQKYPR